MMPLLLIVAIGCTRRAIVTESQLQGGIVGSGAWTRDELFFGLSLPSGGVVSDSAFNAFVQDEVVERFPEGFTILSGTGYYRAAMSSQTVREPARVLLVLYRDTEPEKARALGELVAIYKRLFQQQSVLRVTSRVRAIF